MGADYAYARGLTGKGVRLALFDSGSALAHPEFAGRNTSSITIGANCATPGVVAGAGACEQTRGEQPGYNYYGLGAGVPAALAARLIAAGQPYGFSYADHGTHVLGTIGANRDGKGMHGVAFGANLTAARVFGDTYYEWRLDPDNFYRRARCTAPIRMTPRPWTCMRRSRRRAYAPSTTAGAFPRAT